MLDDKLRFCLTSKMDESFQIAEARIWYSTFEIRSLDEWVRLWLQLWTLKDGVWSFQ